MGKRDKALQPRAVSSANRATAEDNGPMAAVAEQMAAQGGTDELAPGFAADNTAAVEAIATQVLAEQSETKHDKFRRLATRRVNKVIGHMLTVKRLANRQNYEYTVDEVKSIITALSECLDDVADAYSGQIEKTAGFTF